MNIQNIAEKIDGIAKEWESFAQSSSKMDGKLQSLESRVSQIQCLMERPDVAEGFIEEKSCFGDFLRKGDVSGVLELKSSLSASGGENGGYLITPKLQQLIVSEINARSPMRKLASIDTISTNALDVVIQDGGFESGWVAETSVRDSTNVPKLKQKRIMVHELYAQPKATQKLIDDAAISIESWLVDKLGSSFTRAENKSFISGDGNNQPTGILHYAEDVIERIPTTQKGKLLPEDILNLIHSLPEEYLGNATLLMHRTTLTEFQKLRDGNGRFIWQPSMSVSVPDTIFGVPVLCASDMPMPKEDASAIAIADFKAAYKIVDRSGISLMRDPYTEKPFVKFYAVKRVGGDVVNPEAIKILKV
jgi:HK97 family phage major capsid protein